MAAVPVGPSGCLACACGANMCNVSTLSYGTSFIHRAVFSRRLSRRLSRRSSVPESPAISVPSVICHPWSTFHQGQFCMCRMSGRAEWGDRETSSESLQVPGFRFLPAMLKAEQNTEAAIEGTIQQNTYSYIS